MTVSFDWRAIDLPIQAALPALRTALAEHPAAVLEAPPGAGKSTLVPLALLAEPWLAGRSILVLEPRRLAARAVAQRLAELLGEPVGATVGYAVRCERRIGPATRIEVVTEGLLVRRLQHDPGLDGVGLVVFDEFHERSLDGDLALTLAMEAQAVLRPELRLLVMSATLDGQAAADLLGGAPFVSSPGRSFPVRTLWRPLAEGARLERAVAEAALESLTLGDGDTLAFLPGRREIEATAAVLHALPGTGGLAVAPLYGELDRGAQARALTQDPAGCRKVVLATSIAETSLTISGVTAVVDAGLARRAVFSPGTGMGRLETLRVSQAAADQRRGRAGRTAPGVCLRLWGEAEHRRLAAFDPPEILAADLAPLALELALWGTPPGKLRWPTPPPAAGLAVAGQLLTALGALDAAGGITAAGRAMAALPVHPRLAAMLLRGRALGLAGTALALAALLSARDPWRQRREVDLAQKLAWWGQRGGDPDPDALRELERVRRQLASLLPAGGPAVPDDAGAALALAYPDRVAQRRAGGAGVFLTASGRGAALAHGEALAGAGWLSVAELDDVAVNAPIRSAARLDPQRLQELLPEAIVVQEEMTVEPPAGRLRARRVTRLGSLVLAQQDRPLGSPEARAAAMVPALRARGVAALPWGEAALRLRARAAFLAREGAAGLPNLDDASLAADLESWLGPLLGQLGGLDELRPAQLDQALDGLIDRRARAELDRLAPSSLATAAGHSAAIDYALQPPRAACRVGDLFGVDHHPTVLGGRLPLSLALLNPAGRPVQVTQDLPGFWRGQWAEVRKELRGRYPRHDWPERPWEAVPSRPAPRGRG